MLHRDCAYARIETGSVGQCLQIGIREFGEKVMYTIREHMPTNSKATLQQPVSDQWIEVSEHGYWRRQLVKEYIARTFLVAAARRWFCSRLAAQWRSLGR